MNSESMTDSKYFTTTKKGEIFELRADLNSDRKDKKKDAVKKVIASMTVGKDVSALFPGFKLFFIFIKFLNRRC